MISSSGDRFPLVSSNRSGGNVQTVAPASSSTRSHLLSKDERKPPCHLAPVADLESMFELGRALGYQKFEIVNLAGRDDGGIVAAHEQKEVRNRETELWSSVRHTTSAMGTPSYDQPALDIDSKFNANRDELQREVERLRGHAENLSRELTFARKDSSRLTELLKKEEGVGREQRRRADEVIGEARKLREELDTLKQTCNALRAEPKSLLSDAHDRSVVMAERRRRQQTESLMHAYKDLYEKELEIQHASMESYRSLTKGYSRLLADNKALKRKIAVATAGPAAYSCTPVDLEQHEDIVVKNVGPEAVESAVDVSTAMAPAVAAAVRTGGSSSTVSTLAGTAESFACSPLDLAEIAFTTVKPTAGDRYDVMEDVGAAIGDPKPREAAAAAPPLEPVALRQRRPFPLEIQTTNSASFPGAIGPPKKSDSPRLGWHRWETSAGDVRDLGCKISPKGAVGQ